MLFSQASGGSTRPGTFSTPAGSRYVSGCSGASSTLTNSAAESSTSRAFTWTPSSSYSGTVEFHAIPVVSRTTFYNLWTAAQPQLTFVAAGGCGTGNLCSGHGSCHTACHACLCTALFDPATACATCVDGYSLVGGSCVALTALGGSCSAGGDCSSGFCVSGACCDSACDSGHGSCSAAGSCTCDPFHSGANCAQCVSSHYLASNGSCLAKLGLGSTCTGAAAAVAATADGGAAVCLSGNCLDPGVCCALSNCGQGNCSAAGDGCVCAAGYYGSSCSNQCPGGPANPCSGHGSCDATTGVCTCVGNFAAPDCSGCGSGFALAGGECVETNLADGANCSLATQCSSGACLAGHCCAVSSCENGGDCSSGACLCFAGFYGGSCQLTCACHALGSSSCHATTGACTCADGYTGTTCSQCDSGYVAAPDGVCLRLQPAGGSCISGTQCASPLFCTDGVCCHAADCGAGNCSSTGGSGAAAGSAGAGGNGTCACDPGVTGAQCDACKPDHYGYPRCSACTAAVSCSGRGSCGPTGDCQCLTGYAAPNCSQCAPAFLPQEGGLCVGNATNNGGACALPTDCNSGFCVGGVCCRTPHCSSAGSCGTGECVCNNTAAYVGIDCSACAPGYFREATATGSCVTRVSAGEPCSSTAECSGSNGCVDGRCCVAPSCGSHGSCSGANGTCVCDMGYSGSACDACAAGYTATANGTCVAKRADGEGCVSGGECVSTTCTDGVCCALPSCNGGVCAAAGSVTAVAGQCACPNQGHGYFGDACLECPGGAANPCSGHGSCNATTGVCECDAGYRGGDCSVCTADSHYSATGGGGVSATCLPRKQVGNCTEASQCVQGRYCVPEPATTLPGLTSQPGMAFCCALPGCSLHGSCAAGDSCVCAAGYYGSSCGNQCPGGAANPCSGHGSCNATTGACTCDAGYTAQDCALRAVGASCSSAQQCEPGNGCTGGGYCCANVSVCAHGNCSTGECLCAHGYGGSSCDVRCPVDSAGGVCGGRGVCAASGHCLCPPAFAGDAACSSCADSHFGPTCQFCNSSSSCSGHGSCHSSTGACVCSGGYLGRDCSASPPPLGVAHVRSAAVLRGPGVTLHSVLAVAETAVRPALLAALRVSQPQLQDSSLVIETIRAVAPPAASGGGSRRLLSTAGGSLGVEVGFRLEVPLQESAAVAAALSSALASDGSGGSGGGSGGGSLTAELQQRATALNLTSAALAADAAPLLVYSAADAVAIAWGASDSCGANCSASAVGSGGGSGSGGVVSVVELKPGVLNMSWVLSRQPGSGEAIVTITLSLRNMQTWLGIAFSDDSKMYTPGNAPSDAVLGVPGGRVQQYKLRGTAASDVTVDPSQDLYGAAMLSSLPSATVMRFSRKLLSTGDAGDRALNASRPLHLLWAYGPPGATAVGYHADRGHLSLLLNRSAAGATAGASSPSPPPNATAPGALQVHPLLSLSWSLSPATQQLTVTASLRRHAWLAVAFAASPSMVNASLPPDAVLCQPPAAAAGSSAAGTAQQYKLTARSAEGVFPDPSQDLTASSCTLLAPTSSGSSSSGGGSVTQLSFTRALDTGDGADHVLPSDATATTTLLWAFGHGPSLAKHAHSGWVVVQLSADTSGSGGGDGSGAGGDAPSPTGGSGSGGGTGGSGGGTGTVGVVPPPPVFPLAMAGPTVLPFTATALHAAHGFLMLATALLLLPLAAFCGAASPPLRALLHLSALLLVAGSVLGFVAVAVDSSGSASGGSGGGGGGGAGGGGMAHLWHPHHLMGCAVLLLALLHGTHTLLTRRAPRSSRTAAVAIAPPVAATSSSADDAIRGDGDDERTGAATAAAAPAADFAGDGRALLAVAAPTALVGVVSFGPPGVPAAAVLTTLGCGAVAVLLLWYSALSSSPLPSSTSKPASAWASNQPAGGRSSGGSSGSSKVTPYVGKEEDHASHAASLSSHLAEDQKQEQVGGGINSTDGGEHDASDAGQIAALRPVSSVGRDAPAAAQEVLLPGQTGGDDGKEEEEEAPKRAAVKMKKRKKKRKGTVLV